MDKRVEFATLLGLTLKSVEETEGRRGLRLVTEQGIVYNLRHEQDCCEDVSIEDIAGDLQDLVGHPILRAQEATNSESNPDGVTKEDQDSFTWTFYKLSTIKGSVTIRFYGESNGYYSEDVDLLLEGGR